MTTDYAGETPAEVPAVPVVDDFAQAQTYSADDASHTNGGDEGEVLTVVQPGDENYVAPDSGSAGQ